jgi:hypothetical protein
MWVLEFIIYSKEEECVQYCTVQYSTVQQRSRGTRSCLVQDSHAYLGGPTMMKATRLPGEGGVSCSL